MAVSVVSLSVRCCCVSQLDSLCGVLIREYISSVRIEIKILFFGAGVALTAQYVHFILIKADVRVELMRRKRIYAVCFGSSSGQHPACVEKCKRYPF